MVLSRAVDIIGVEGDALSGVAAADPFVDNRRRARQGSNEH